MQVMPNGNARPASPLAICVAGALSLAVAMGIGRFAFTPLLPLMIRDGQIDVAVGGWIAAANYVGYLLGALTASRIRSSSNRLVGVALALTALLTAAMAAPGSVTSWLVLRLLAGAASAWAFIATSVWCLGALAKVGRTSWGAAVYTGVGSGITIAGLYCLAGGALGASAASLWLQLGLLAALLSVPVAAVLRKTPAESARAANAPASATALPSGTTGVIVCYALFGFGYILPATFLPVLARAVVPDPALFGLAWPLFGAMAVLSNLFAGWCLRHASRLQVWSAAQCLMGIGVLLPSLSPGGVAIGLSALLVGGTFMVITMIGVQEIRARAPHAATSAVARMTTAFALGQIGGPVASSLLLWLPATHGNGLNLALQAGATGLLVSAAWLWREQSRAA
jgi:predicted MFS family arabinose efflux permease